MKILDKVIYDRRLRWYIKKKKIQYYQNIIDSSLNHQQKKIVFKEILFTKRYTRLKNIKRVLDKINYFKTLQNSFYEKNKKLTFYFYKIDEFNYYMKDRLKKKIKRYKLRLHLFKRNYKINLLNNLNSDFSLGYYFNKFYLLPGLNNLNTLKSYLKNYKIIYSYKRLSVYNYKKRRVMHKFPTVNPTIVLNKFIKMYGLRWL